MPSVSDLTTFFTGKLTFVDPTLYVFVNVSGASAVESAVAVRVPSWLSTTVTVTVPVVVPFSIPLFSLPSVALSVTVYVYVPGLSNVSSLYVSVPLVLPVPLIVTESTSASSLSVSAKS